MKMIAMLLAAFAVLITTAQAQLADNAGPEGLDFFLGEWSIVNKSVQRDGSFIESRAHSKVSKILDGSALFDEWRSLDQNGDVVFRGASFRTYLPRHNKWSIQWLMSNVPGHTTISAKIAEGELQMQGEGVDPIGAFLERARYFDISENGYKFTMDRSYDGGGTWIAPFNEFVATRITPDD